MKLIDRILDAQGGLGHGPWSEADSGWVDPKPYISHYSNGVFEGYDGSVWVYFETPEDVRIHWLSDELDAVRNQHFFVDLSRDLSKMLGGESSARKDVRRDFHFHSTRYDSGKYEPFPGCTPEHADYLERMSSQLVRPLWRSFFGVRLLPSSIFYETYGARQRLARAIDALRNPGRVEWLLLKQDLDDIMALLPKHGFRVLDFTKDVDALERLTAHHGVADDERSRPKQLQSQPVQEFKHGRSLLTPRYGEISFYALRPEDGVDLQDPLETRSRWGEALYYPQADVGVISIRGEIRALPASDNLLDIRAYRNDRGDNGDSVDHNVSIGRLIEIARNSVSEDGLPVVDNVEIVVGSVVRQQEVSERPLVSVARDMGMRASVLVDRQAVALMSTFPTYPHHVARVKRTNRKRPALTNVMLPGVLAFSGVFRANKPAGHKGLLVGYGDAGSQYPEIFIDPAGASQHNLPPTMLISGRPGAGKTMQLIQMCAQAAFAGKPVVYLNPKSTGSLRPYFDYLGGVTVSMSMKYLEDNPGLLDPVFFLADRDQVAAILTDAITVAMRMSEDVGSEGAQRRTILTAEIRERAMDRRNVTSAQILFGNTRAGTLPLSQTDVLQFVHNKMQTSPFWRALISVNSQSTLTATMQSARSLLIEWGGGMELPSSPDAVLTDAQIDTVLSVTTVFRYAGNKLEGTGGILVIDESWLLRASTQARFLLERAGREWREANIMLILGTQLIRDWAGGDGGDLQSFVSRFLFMAIAEQDAEELRLFFKLAGLPDTPQNRDYIVNAGVRRGSNGQILIPRGYLVDMVHDWRGGILCGPWPQRELNLGRTDVDAKMRRLQEAGDVLTSETPRSTTAEAW